jgi:hypothetical protein
MAEVSGVAGAASERQIDIGTTRDDPIELVKSSFSIEKTRERVSQMESNPTPKRVAKRNWVRRPGFPAGSVIAIMSGIVILALLTTPIYGFTYQRQIASNAAPTSISDFYASGFDLALGSMMFRGALTQLPTQSLAIWLIVATSILVIVFGFFSLMGSNISARSRLGGLLVGHSGVVIAILGMVLVLLSFVATREIQNTVMLVIPPNEYWGDVVYPTVVALAVMGLIVSFSGLEVKSKAL